jgi:LmbE family N-acetylglucosaminyl deacetylase
MVKLLLLNHVQGKTQTMQKTVYLSPHLDDAILSCGAILFDQVNAEGKAVEIWTVFAADAPAGELSPFADELHQRWHTEDQGPSLRRREDEAACAILGCRLRHLPFADCIYRFLPDGEARILTNDDLFTFAVEKDQPMLKSLAAYLHEHLPETCELVVPLGVGGHIDHRITRLAAELLHRPLQYYADFPYAGGSPSKVKEQLSAEMHPQRFSPSADGLRAWQDATAAYESQISTFWPSTTAMRNALIDYSRSELGSILWKTQGLVD